MIRSVLIACVAVLIAGATSGLAEERVVFESEAFADLTAEERAEIVQILVDNDLLPADEVLTVPDSTVFEAFDLRGFDALASVRPLPTWSGMVDELTVSSPQAAGTSTCMAACSALETTALAACGVTSGTQYLACLAAVFAGSAICRGGCWFLN